MKDNQFKTVVVGVDFSSYSKVVAKQAAKIAKDQGAALVYVHTVRSSDFMSSDAPYLNLDEDVVRPLAEDIVKFYNLKKSPAQPKVVVNLGWASDGIISTASQFESPLIVVGHKGSSSVMGRFFLGSTAEQLALHSPYPVWIHRGKLAKIPKKILVPSDYSARTTTSFTAAQVFKNSQNSKYEFFHVVQPPALRLDALRYKQIVDELRQYESTQQSEWNKKYPQVPLVCKSGEAASLIAKESKKFDLVAMAPHNRKGIFSAFGSVTAKVIRQGNTPLLIVH